MIKASVDKAAPDGPAQRANWALSNTAVATALAGAVLFAVVTTWLLLSPLVENINSGLLTLMIVANVLIAAGFAILILFRLWHVWSDRRHQLAGSQTHMHLVGMFALVAVAPSVIAFLFAFTILRTSLNDVFSDRIERYHNTARDLANSLVAEKAADLEILMRQIAFDIRRNEEAGLGLEATPITFRQYLFAQAQLRQLAALYVLDGQGRLLVRAEVEEGVYNLPTAAALANLNANAAPGELFTFGVNDDTSLDTFRGALSLPQYGGGFIIGYQSIDPAMTQRLFAVNALRSDWREAERGRSRAESVFLAGYILLAIIILSGAVWLGLWAATRIVKPIGRLIGMAERVSSGDLGSRVEVYRDDGELGALARSMNHMTAQLQTQRNDLVETNKQFDRRRRFTEAVLSGVSAGVVGVSAEGRITIANRSAADLLGVDADKLTGASISETLPELESMLNSISGACNIEIADQIELIRNDRIRTVNVRIVSDQVDGERSLVITFDDITQLIAAQRNAAWGDVARRIAHEIKNPLTPIQLSAERLRRKYLTEVKTTPEIFDKCTETIIRHVSDIGRMVDEFSSFARMPKPVIAREDLRELVKSAIFPQRVAAPDIEFSFDAPELPVLADCDGRLIVQALSNLLKNATESIAARAAGAEASSAGKIKVAIVTRANEARIDVIDNGVGLPKTERHRLTEPYMTTRVKGTGLGLAIVRKVIEEHGGSLRFDDDHSLGATGARVSVVLPARMEGAGDAPVRAAAE
ncbi:MAG: PAS domain-containing sensor histidine kinase [Pseudomonadota bacterium]|nr:PAS domain-containing sensor histidine kinase [Pseudomonadota bacterium]